MNFGYNQAMAKLPLQEWCVQQNLLCLENAQKFLCSRDCVLICPLLILFHVGGNQILRNAVNHKQGENSENFSLSSPGM